MTKARDLANLGSTATVLATDSEVSAATASLASTSYVDSAVAAIPAPDLSSIIITDVMDSL
jgi:hypothetical protein